MYKHGARGYVNRICEPCCRSCGRHLICAQCITIHSPQPSAHSACCGCHCLPRCDEAAVRRVVQALPVDYSYKRVKGRSHTVEKRKASHPQKPHATSQPSRFSHFLLTPFRSIDDGLSHQPSVLAHVEMRCRNMCYSRLLRPSPSMASSVPARTCSVVCMDKYVSKD